MQVINIYTHTVLSNLYTSIDGSIDYHSTIQQPSIQRLLEELHVLTPPVLPSSSDDKDPTITHKFRALNEAETCVALIPRIGKDFVPANLKYVFFSFICFIINFRC